MVFVRACPLITSKSIGRTPSIQPIGNQHSDTEGAYSDTCDFVYYKMSAEIHRLFPEGLKYAKAEREKSPHDPPLRCVPLTASEKEDVKGTKLKMITVVLDQDTTQKVCLYEFDVIETFLKMQKKYSYFLAQYDVRKKWNKYDKLEDAVLVKIKAVSHGTTDTKEIATLK